MGESPIRGVLAHGDGVQIDHAVDAVVRFLQPDPVTRERIAVGMRPDLPVELVVREVRVAVSAEVPVDATRPQVRSRHAVGGAEVGRDDADRSGALLEDR